MDSTDWSHDGKQHPGYSDSTWPSAASAPPTDASAHPLSAAGDIPSPAAQSPHTDEPKPDGDMLRTDAKRLQWEQPKPKPNRKWHGPHKSHVKYIVNSRRALKHI